MIQKQILVVGGAGFIGSHVNKMLHQAGYQTVVLDNLSRGQRSACVRGTFVEGDMGHPGTLDQIFSSFSFEAVMLFAAFIDVGESIYHPGLYYENNVVKVLPLLQAMVRHKVPRLIFSSSAAVYGLPMQSKIDEQHPTHPINPYGETKLMVEKMLYHFDRAHGLKSCSLRYFNAAGGDPEGEIKDQKRSSNLIPLALRSLLTQQPIKIFGTDYPTPDGTCIRDYVHISDLGTAHICALEKLLAHEDSSIYNLGNGEGFTVRQVLHAIEKVTHRKLPILDSDRRPGDPPVLVADATKALKELGWQPQYSELESMVAHAWQAIS